MKQQRKEFEKKTVEKLIRIYCRHKHGSKLICIECNELLLYAIDRVNNCMYGVNKPVCANCKIHCYRKDMRKKIIEVMKYSGPRILFIHPIVTVRYLIYKFRKNNFNKA